MGYFGIQVHDKNGSICINSLLSFPAAGEDGENWDVFPWGKARAWSSLTGLGVEVQDAVLGCLCSSHSIQLPRQWERMFFRGGHGVSLHYKAVAGKGALTLFPGFI